MYPAGVDADDAPDVPEPPDPDPVPAEPEPEEPEPEPGDVAVPLSTAVS